MPGSGGGMLLVVHGQGTPGALAIQGAIPAAPVGSMHALAAGLYYNNCI